jgi:hypothetical protein
MDLPDAAAHARSSGLGPRVIYFSLAILTNWPGSSDGAIFFASFSVPDFVDNFPVDEAQSFGSQ